MRKLSFKSKHLLESLKSINLLIRQIKTYFTRTKCLRKK